MAITLERDIMNWPLILKTVTFPGKGKTPAWLDLLQYEGGVLEVWIDKAKKVLEEDKSPSNFATFIRLIRDIDSEYAAENLLQLHDFSISERNRIDDLAEKNLETLKEAFKEYIDKPVNLPPAASASQNKARATIELFQQAANYIEQERDVDWEELEGAISEINDNRTLDGLLQTLGDEVNSIIATNLPEEGVDRLTAFYKKYSFGVAGYQKNFSVNTVTDELALVYLTVIQEATTLPGKSESGNVARGFLPNPDNPASRKPSAKTFKVKKLPKIQIAKGKKKRFTDLFLSLFKGDLSSQSNITNQLARDLKNRAVNKQAVLDVVSDIAFDVNQGSITIEEASRKSGLDFNSIENFIPSIKENDKEAFKNEFKNSLFDDGAKGQRGIVRQFENKMTQYRNGVPKLFKDFITHLIGNPNIYEEAFNLIYTNSYAKFRQGSETGGFIQIGTMPGKSGKRVAIWKLQKGSDNYGKLLELYKWLINRDQQILNQSDDNGKRGLRALRKLYRQFKNSNMEDTKEELFGNLLNISAKDESELLRRFTDPFEKSIASLFIEVKDGKVNLNDLTSKYEVKLSKTINTVDLIQELHMTEQVTGSSGITGLLTNKYPAMITADITDDNMVKVVKSFISDLDKVVKNIVIKVKQLITEKLNTMVKNQGIYLPFNRGIFNILENKGLITEV